MARNEEKANALLNRWLDAKAGILGTKRDPKKRPFLATGRRNFLLVGILLVSMEVLSTAPQ